MFRRTQRCSDEAAAPPLLACEPGATAMVRSLLWVDVNDPAKRWSATMRRPILVINDDPRVRDTLQDTLSGAGFDVRTAPDGVEGMQTLLRHAPCWVLLDLHMPVMDGFEFLAALRRVPFPPRIFIATEVDDRDSLERAFRLGGEHAFSQAQILSPGFGGALREALGLPAVDPQPSAQRAA